MDAARRFWPAEISRREIGLKPQLSPAHSNRILTGQQRDRFGPVKTNWPAKSGRTFGRSKPALSSLWITLLEGKSSRGVFDRSKSPSVIYFCSAFANAALLPRRAGHGSRR